MGTISKAREKLVGKFGEDVVYKLESGESVTLDKLEMIAVTNEARCEIISELLLIIESDERLAGDFLDQMQGDGRGDFLASVGKELTKIFKM